MKIKFSKKSSLILIVAFGIILVAELMSFLYLRSLPPLPDTAPLADCREEFESHPFFAIRYKPNGCKDYNNIGVKGADMPAVRNDEVFTVLVLGSRLAEQLTLNLADDQASFEAYLNRHWLPPSGKTFRVVNGAVAGHKAPIWFYQLSVFLNRVDAVIVFEDHYEEILNDGNLQLEEPPTAWQITKHATLFPMEVFLKRQVSGLLAHSIISKSFSASAVIRKFNDSLNERSTESQTSDPIPPFRDVDNATARSMNLENYLRYSRYADRLAEIEDKDFFLIFSDPSNDQANARSSRNTLIDYFKLHAKDINFSMPPAGADLQTVAAFAAERMAKHGGWRKRQQP